MLFAEIGLLEDGFWVLHNRKETAQFLQSDVQHLFNIGVRSWLRDAVPEDACYLSFKSRGDADTPIEGCSVEEILCQGAPVPKGKAGQRIRPSQIHMYLPGSSWVFIAEESISFLWSHVSESSLVGNKEV